VPQCSLVVTGDHGLISCLDLTLHVDLHHPAVGKCYYC